MHETSPHTLLIVGAGAREHALTWKARQSPLVKDIYNAPGNAGTEQIARSIPRGTKEIDELIKYAHDLGVTHTIVGPEDPLALGIVDEFTREGLSIFGPTKEAARLEWSKAWTADFLARHPEIPSPQSFAFTREEDALDFVDNCPWPDGLVIKLDGLAQGKGVFMPETKEQAREVIRDIYAKKIFSTLGPIVLQEFLVGEEVSAIGISDGTTILPLLPSQDHKRLLDGDQGPNTGGMGAYTPVPFVSSQMQTRIYQEILQPTIDAMREEQTIFKGVLYAGIMLTNNGPKVLEFNARFGDPETEAQMMMLADDLVPISLESAQGQFRRNNIAFKDGTAMTVVLAADNYPGSKKGDPIQILDTASDPDIAVFHGATLRNPDGTIVTNGGRILSPTARGATLFEAKQKVMSLIESEPRKLYFPGMQFRRDIGKSALREVTPTY
ncbi:MAG TPA: phosphoribosylamine--glycine ligase [Patescibacteria group bacterium]|nr:phosphoribosylamine--glycine ligase [Patescibacteria group bacterium]